MPRTSLTVQEPTRFTQINTPTANAVDNANGNRFTNDGKIILRVVNGSGGALTVTVDNPNSYDTDLAVPNRTYSISNGVTALLGPWPTNYNQMADSTANQLLVDWSTGTSVTCEVIRVTAV